MTITVDVNGLTLREKNSSLRQLNSLVDLLITIHFRYKTFLQTILSSNTTGSSQSTCCRKTDLWTALAENG